MLPEVVERSRSSATVRFKQLLVKKELSSYYSYVAQIETEDKQFTRASRVLNHSERLEYNFIVIDDLSPRLEYAMRILPRRHMVTGGNISLLQEGGDPSRMFVIQANGGAGNLMNDDDHCLHLFNHALYKMTVLC